MRRKVFGILFSVLLFAPATSTFIWLQHKKYLIKYEVKEQIIKGLDKSELSLLRFTDWELENKLDWEDDHEFEYKGMMYDIVEKKKQGNITLIWCWADKEETEINKSIKSIADNLLGNDKESQQRQASLVHFLKTLYSSDSPEWRSSIPEPSELNFKPFLIAAYSEHISSLDRPPAKSYVIS